MIGHGGVRVGFKGCSVFLHNAEIVYWPDASCEDKVNLTLALNTTEWETEISITYLTFLH